MKIGKIKNIVGKEVFDVNGITIGRIDKMWNSWNQKQLGPFFGIRPNEHARDTWFRGTYRLIPIYSNYIRDIGKYVILNKTMDELRCFWNKTVQCGSTTCPTDELLDKPVYDKNHSRIGTFFASVESNGLSKKYGVLRGGCPIQLAFLVNTTSKRTPYESLCRAAGRQKTSWERLRRNIAAHDRRHHRRHRFFPWSTIVWQSRRSLLDADTMYSNCWDCHNAPEGN